MTDEAKALVERVETLPDTHALPSTLALLFDLRDCVETQAREIERLGVIAQGNASIVCKILDEKDAEIERLNAMLTSAMYEAKAMMDEIKRLGGGMRVSLGDLP